MLNELLIPFREYFGFLNLFEYITFRAGASAILALLISFIFGPFVVRKLINLQIGESIRDHGPSSHKNKQGTPCLLYTSPSPRDRQKSRMPSSA